MTPDATDFDLSPETAGAYFQCGGVVPECAAPTARSLGGGVSNHVVEVAWDGGCVVAKQPLANLAVEDDWPADVSRVHNEAAAGRAYARVIEAAGLDDVRVPAVVFEDAAAHVIAIECAPDGAPPWKRELLDGQVDRGVARTVGRVLGAVHAAAAGDEDLRERFGSKDPFDQLRVDPYHRRTAERHPEVRDAILAEAERVLSVDRTLVHGDYSPKNVLVDRTECPPTAWIIDHEVAHWGDPAFDPAFMLNHLFIKSIYNGTQHRDYVAAARAFWAAYTDQVPWDVEAETVAELAVLMLARVDGKSPVEYVEGGPVAAALRTVAVGALRDGDASLDAFASRAAAEVPTT